MAPSKSLVARRVKPRTGSIRQSVFFEASPSEIYEALTDPKKHSRFTGSPASGTQRAGREFTAWDGYITGKNIVLQKGKRIVQDWRTSEWPEGYPPSRLELTLSAKGDGTQLLMRQSAVPLEQLDNYRSGWIESYWEPLKAYLSSRKRHS